MIPIQTENFSILLMNFIGSTTIDKHINSVYLYSKYEL